MRINKPLMGILNQVELVGNWNRSKKDFIIWLSPHYPEEWKDWHNANEIHNALFEINQVIKTSIEQDFDKICGKVLVRFKIK